MRPKGCGPAAAALLAAGCGAGANVDRCRCLAAEAREDAPTTPDRELAAGIEAPDCGVRAVFARNSDVAAARFRAAAAEQSQAKAVLEPRVIDGAAPASVLSSRAPLRRSAPVAQRPPRPGRLERPGEMAIAEAEMRRGDAAAARLRLAIAASRLYGELFATARALAVTAEQLVLLDVPSHPGGRDTAAGHAAVRVAGARHELERMQDQVRVQVDTALARLGETDDLVGPFEKRVLPAARSRVEVARTGFVTATNAFAAVMEAERNLRGLKADLEMACAALLQPHAEVERAPAVTRAIGGER